jgi:hypothetical protein
MGLVFPETSGRAMPLQVDVASLFSYIFGISIPFLGVQSSVFPEAASAAIQDHVRQTRPRLCALSQRSGRGNRS